MLKDLDQRNGEPQGVGSVNAPMVQTKSSSKNALLGGIIAILCFIIVVMAWFHFSEEKANPLPPVKPQVTVNHKAAVDTKENVNNKKPADNKVASIKVKPIKKPQKNSKPVVTASHSAKAKPKSVVAKPTLAKKAKPQMAVSRRKISPKQLVQQKMAQAEKSIDDNKLAKAEHLFEDILLLQSSHKDARKQLAALWYGRKAYQDAINLLSQGIALDSKDSEFRLMQARIYLKQGQAQSAFNTLQGLAQIENSEYQAARANAAQLAGQFKFAVDAYQTLLESAPTNGRWWLGLAVAFDSDGQFDKASQAYSAALNQKNLSASSIRFIKQRMQQLRG